MSQHDNHGNHAHSDDHSHDNHASSHDAHNTHGAHSDAHSHDSHDAHGTHGAHSDDHSDSHDPNTPIALSSTTKSLVDSIQHVPLEHKDSRGTKYEVSQTVSFFGFIYEKLRNSIEFNDEHLIRRIAITRILKRRLAMNKLGKNEGENLVRELLWGRYITSDGISQEDVEKVQDIINAYVMLAKYARRIDNMLIHLLSSEIEEHLASELSMKNKIYLYYFYHILHSKISIPNLPEDQKNRYFYVACEKALMKNDEPIIQYHIFALQHGTLVDKKPAQIAAIGKSYNKIAKEIQNAITNPYTESLTRFAKKHSAPFRILFHLIEQKKTSAIDTLSQSAPLKAAIGDICTLKYKETGIKLRAAAYRSITYIFITKMALVLVLEFPLTKYIYGHVEYMSLFINTLFPPFLMGVIVSFINPPSTQNTAKITKRIIEIIDKDTSFENSKEKAAKTTQKSAMLLFIFTIFYVFLFSFVFASIYVILDYMNFNIISKAIFMFFMSVVAFFGYRIRQTSKEYVLESQSNILISTIGFLFLPILYVGKTLSAQISRLNVFIILFDSFIEAPFKFFIDVFEEWSRFVKARKDELM